MGPPSPKTAGGQAHCRSPMPISQQLIVPINCRGSINPPTLRPFQGQGGKFASLIVLLDPLTYPAPSGTGNVKERTPCKQAWSPKMGERSP